MVVIKIYGFQIISKEELKLMGRNQMEEDNET